MERSAFSPPVTVCDPAASLVADFWVLGLWRRFPVAFLDTSAAARRSSSCRPSSGSLTGEGDGSLGGGGSASSTSILKAYWDKVACDVW